MIFNNKIRESAGHNLQLFKTFMNARNVIGIIGLLTTITFVIGYVGLIAVNPNVSQELNNVSLATYNIKGLDGQTWASIVNYNLVGLLNIIFAWWAF